MSTPTLTNPGTAGTSRPASHANVLAAIFGDPISVYTRADALRDGVLLTLDPGLCTEQGFGVPVDITRAAWLQVIECGERQEIARPGALQDETGRTADVLAALAAMMRRVDPDCPLEYGDRHPFSVYRVAPTGRSLRPRRHVLHAVFGHDDVQPVITIMEPDED